MGWNNLQTEIYIINGHSIVIYDAIAQLGPHGNGTTLFIIPAVSLKKNDTVHVCMSVIAHL